METNSEIGQRIRIKREEHDMTQQKLADICGISVSYIGYLERGKRIGNSILLLSKIAQVLSTSIDYLVNGESGSYIKDALSDIEQHIKNFSENDVNQIVSIVKAYRNA